MARLEYINTRFLGLIVIILVILFGIVEYGNNESIKETQECILDTRKSAANWVTEFIQFLENIDTQEGVHPLIISAEMYLNELNDCK